MERMMKSELYTFQEILNICPISAVPSGACLSTNDEEWFTKMLSYAGLEYQRYGLDSTITDADIKAIINSLINIVYDRHASDYVYRADSPALEADHVLDIQDLKKVFIKVINIINITLSKYLPMLTAFKTSSANPIAPIKSKSTGESRFNDTPQDIGDFGDEDHTTNISNSISESEVDTGSIVERLSDLFKNYKSIVLEWSNEFNQLFFKEEQFYE